MGKMARAAKRSSTKIFCEQNPHTPSREEQKYRLQLSIEKGNMQQQIDKLKEQYKELVRMASNVGYNEMMIISMYYLHCKHGYGSKGLESFNKWMLDLTTGIKADKNKIDRVSSFSVDNILEALEAECDMDMSNFREMRKNIDRLALRI